MLFFSRFLSVCHLHFPVTDITTELQIDTRYLHDTWGNQTLLFTYQQRALLGERNVQDIHTVASPLTNQS